MNPDTPLAVLAAQTYQPDPPGHIIDWRDCRAILTGTTLAVRGTVPDSWKNWLRDFETAPSTPRDHPALGPCDTGALEAALGFLPLLPGPVETATGHSLGGQIATILAALCGAKTLVTWDAPKAGDSALRGALAGAAVRSYRFASSIVTDWPFLRHEPVAPLVEIGAPTLNPVKAHSIERMVGWLEK